GMPTEPDAGALAYDGFGNPVGFINLLPPLLRVTPPRITWSPVLRQFVRSIFSPTQNRWIQVPVPAGAMPARRPWPPRSIPPSRRPGRLGWLRPSLPSTGLGPTRLYMRCAVWPGPQGLVPAVAAQTPAAGGMGRRRWRPRRR